MDQKDFMKMHFLKLHFFKSSKDLYKMHYVANLGVMTIKIFVILAIDSIL